MGLLCGDHRWLCRDLERLSGNKYVYYGSDWNKDIITPPTDFFNDVSNGNLRQISWVTPTWGNSDHAGSGSKTGPQWVASVVNAIGNRSIGIQHGDIHLLG